MRMLLAAFGSSCVLQLAPAFAAAWPDNWLGPPNPRFVTLNIGVFYYGAVIDDFPAEDGTPAFPEDVDWLFELEILPDQMKDSQTAELERIQLEMGEAARFYWRNTRFNLALDYDWHIEQQPIMRSSIASSEGPYHSPVDQPAYGDLRKEYDGLVQIMVMYRYDEESGELQRVVGGGGFTWGLDAETMECGWSWWVAPPASHACGSDWLMVHEFGHQLDSMFDESGHPEVWFNHLSPSEGNVARFGEHFDANSYILRRIPEADWGDLLWGSYDTFEDKDADNVPDSSDYFDTLGLITDPDPGTPDADGDDLTDYDEFMASNGNRFGHGERLHPGILLCDPKRGDTDGDGILDGSDPLPMYPFSRYVPRVPIDKFVAKDLASAHWDMPEIYPCGTFYKNLCVMPNRLIIWETWGPSGFSPDAIYPGYSPDLVYPGISADIYYRGANSWEDGESQGLLIINLCVDQDYLSDSLCDLKIMLDLNNDGWFTGNDNYQIQIENGEVVKVLQHGTSSPTDWPQPKSLDVNSLDLSGKELGKESGFEFSESGEVSLFEGQPPVIRVVINQEHFPELAAKPGEMIGFNIGVKRPGENWYYMVGEPNTLIPMELR